MKALRLFLLLVALTLTCSMSAYKKYWNYEFEGIYYELHDDYIATVLGPYKQQGQYAGDFVKDLSVTSVTIPEKIIYNEEEYVVSFIEANAFSDCKELKKVTLPSAIYSIRDYAFKGCTNLEEINLQSITFIGCEAFKDCANLADSLIICTNFYPLSAYKSNIGKRQLYELYPNCFEGCTSLKTIVLPDAPGRIHSNVFKDCPNITSIVVKRTPRRATYSDDYIAGYVWVSNEFTPMIVDNTFDETVFLNAKVYIRKGGTNTFKYLDGWKNFFNFEELEFIRPANASMKYGDDMPTIGYETDTDTPLAKDPEFTYVQPTTPIGIYAIDIINEGIYDASYMSDRGCLTINPASLTASVGNYTREQGQENPEFVIEYKGFKNGETEEVLTEKVTAITNATIDSPPGEYEIKLKGGKADNYNISLGKSGTLFITEASAISDVRTSGTETYRVYNTSGMLVKQKTGTLDDLPQGVYIVNKRKVLVK